jgi:hypothetical protein
MSVARLAAKCGRYARDVATIDVLGDRVIVRLSTAERILALAGSDPEAPLSAVRSARVVRPAKTAIRGFRAPGTGIPSVIALGHWRGKGHDFVAVYGDHAGVVIELEDQPYARFVVSVDDPDEVVAAIEKGGSRRPSTT